MSLSFSAALLAGGRSTRMGRDKALLTVPGSDELLWQRQLKVLQELEPQEIFWSGPMRPGVPENIRIVPDGVENAGPLAGVNACLDLVRSDLLLVLAIDLPRMSAAFLRGMLERCSPDSGAVVRRGDFFEPLAAIYPREMRPLAAEHLLGKRCVLQDFVREGIRRSWLQAFPLEEEDAALFKNLNAPGDLLETDSSTRSE